MNTANLQLEGLLMAVAALTNALKEKGLLTQGEVEAALLQAETAAAAEHGASGQLSEANVDAIHFPIRLLRLANEAGTGPLPGFKDLTKRVGELKAPH